MTTIIPFTPSPNANFQFQCTLDGASYNVICTFNPYAQRYYVTIYDLTGTEILSRPLIASPSFSNISLTLGFFETSIIYRESSEVFEIPGIPPVAVTRPPPPPYIPPPPPPPPPPQPPDPYFADVILLLHGEGATGSTDIVDSSLHHTALTTVGTVAVENSVEYFDGGAIAIPFGSWLLSSDPLYNFNGASFTFEGWFYLPALAGPDRGQAMFSTGSPGSTVDGALVSFVHTDGSIELYSADNFGNNPHDLVTPAAVVPAGRWFFVSVTQVVIGGHPENPANQAYIHVNGILAASRVGVMSGGMGRGINIGNYGAFSESLPLHAYIQEYRVTLVARYGAANYTVPVQRFPDY